MKLRKAVAAVARTGAVTAEEVRAAHGAALARACAEQGIEERDLGQTLRIEATDGVVRTAVIELEPHVDDVQWTPTRIDFRAAGRNWLKLIDDSARIDAHLRAPLIHRRRDFDPAGAGVAPPAWAWLIHPIAASVLLHGGMDAGALDRGPGHPAPRLLTPPDGPVLEQVALSVERGVVTLESAVIISRGKEGAHIRHRRDEIVVQFPGELPEAVAEALGEVPAAAISDIFGHHPRAAGMRIREHVPRDGCFELVFDDALAPWDPGPAGQVVRPWHPHDALAVRRWQGRRDFLAERMLRQQSRATARHLYAALARRTTPAVV